MWNMYKYVLKHYSKKQNFVCYTYIYNHFFSFTTFHFRGQTNVTFLHVPRSVISQDIFKKTYRNVLFRFYILTLALCTVRLGKPQKKVLFLVVRPLSRGGGERP